MARMDIRNRKNAKRQCNRLIICKSNVFVLMEL